VIFRPFPELDPNERTRAMRVATLKRCKLTRKAPYAGAQSDGKGGYRACISTCGRQVELGSYKEPKLASLAYNSALWLLGERPVSIDPAYFEQPHSEQLQNFITRIAERLGRPYVPPQSRVTKT
jgi:hypothetical protein